MDCVNFPVWPVIVLFAFSAAAAVAAKLCCHRFYAVLKGLPVLVLVCWLCSRFPAGRNPVTVLVASGLILGLAGDLFLLNVQRFFSAGLAAFLAGHLVYASAFLYGGSLHAVSGVVVFPCALCVVFLYRKTAGEMRRYLPAAAVYAAVLACMSAAAVSSDLSHLGGFPLFSIGAAAFCVSDGFLAWTLFVKKNDVADAANIVIYYFAQAAIAAGGVWHE